MSKFLKGADCRPADRSEEFALIVRRETDKVYNLAYRLCGNAQQARDLTQETFARAWASFDRFEGRSAVFTYLFRITCNLWKNSLRRPAFHSLTADDGEGERVELEFPDRRPHFLDDLRREEEGERVRRCLMLLAPPERMIVVLRDIEGRSYREIARTLGCLPGTVKSRLARARRKLAGFLAGPGEGK